MMLASSALVALTGFGAVPALAASAVATVGAQAATAVPDNILLAEWTGPYGGVPPWDKVSPALFAPAFQFAIDEQRREIQAIANNPQAPTFANTIEAMERAGQRLSRVETIFGVMTNNLATPEIQGFDGSLTMTS